MPAPDNTFWGQAVKNNTRYGKIGIAITQTNTNTKTTVNIQTWFWASSYLEDGDYGYFFDLNSTYATTRHTGGPYINCPIYTTNHAWDTRNQAKLGESTFTYDRETSAKTIDCAARLIWIDAVGAEMTVTTSFTIPAVPTYKITYNANGGTGAPGNQTKVYDVAINLSTTKPTRTGYSFLGWSTSSTATSASYQPGASYSANAALTLYAVWKANTYTVTYDANGGNYAPAPQTKTHDIDLAISSDVPERLNYNFLGWGVSATSTTVSYSPGDLYISNASTTLYAVWELAYIAPRLTGISLNRCTEDGIPNEEGSYFMTKFDWVSEYAGVTIEIKWKSANDADWSIATFNKSGTSGSVAEVVGNGLVTSDSTYTVKIKVADSNGYTEIERTLSSAAYPIDFYHDGTGVAFGKASELPNVLDSKWEIYEEGQPLSSRYVKSNELRDRVYPIDSIYISYTHTSPADIFGGTWTRIENQFLWGCDETGIIGQTGGSKTVTLTVDQIPSHSHGSVYSQHAEGTKSYAWYATSGDKIAYGAVATGNGAAHNNMPPYIQVSIWRRIA